VLNLVWPLIAGYLIGSFPTAYLVVRWKSRRDIREMGSGNVGTLNSYEVTGSKAVGLIVLIADTLKGVLAVLVGRGLIPGLPFVGAAFAGTAAVIGHSYPVWLLFKGGRGLATAAGAMGVLCPPLVAAWLLLWGMGYAFTKAVNVASVIACAVLLAALLSVPDDAIRAVLPDGATARGLRAFGVLLLIVMLTRLAGPLREYLRGRRARHVPERSGVA
jgi:glycerol-3-phosphate acyltransferase PlsY